MGKVTVIDGNPWKTNLIISAIIFAVGIAVAIGGKGSLDIVLMVAGALIILGSVLSLAVNAGAATPFSVLICAIGLILGIALVAAPSFFRDAMMVILAIAIVIIGVMYILGASMLQFPGARIIGIIIGVLMVAVGSLMIFNPSFMADVIMTVAGILLAVFGLIGIYSALSSRR